MTFTVTTTADDNDALGTPPGPDTTLSLREAILAANANPTTAASPNIINFNISAAGTVQTINVGGTAGPTAGTALPALMTPTIINGYSEMGASVNTLANGDNAKILIELNGANAGPNADGILLGTGSDGSTIEGLAINRFSLNGIELQSGTNTIQGNFVGTNPQGTAAEPNQNDGIHISNSSGSTIGGTTPGARNIASGNQIDGIHVVGATGSPATNNLIEGNFVGVNAAGTGSVGIKAIGGAAGTPAGNFVFGIEISGGNGTTVGGATAGARNVVGFNAAGIEIDNGGQGNVVQGNFSGVGADGITPVGNNLHGIVLRSDDNLSPPLGPGQTNEPAVSGNIVGLDPNTNFSGLGNLVEFNGTGGIAVFGNPLPNNASPLQNSGNSILGNSVFENGRSSTTTPLLGIDLTNGFVFPKDDGFTSNDSKGHGASSDPNNFLNFPTISAVVRVAGGVQITGTVTEAGEANTMLRLEFFSNNPDPLGLPAEGQTFLGATNVTTNGSGTASFSVTFNTSVRAGQLFTATATNLTADPLAQAGAVNTFNTSEFSPGVALAPSPVGFVQALYADFLGRTAAQSEVNVWLNVLPTLGQAGVVNGIIHSPEALTHAVDGFYVKFLGRAAVGSEEMGWVAALQNGQTEEQVLAGILSSPEFAAHANALIGGSNADANYVQALYKLLLNRMGSTAEVNVWLSVLPSGRASVALGILGSPEYRTDVVTQFYGTLLHRLTAPGASEVAGWVNSGLDILAIEVAFGSSPEYFQNG
jgi:hypothetical protein